MVKIINDILDLKSHELIDQQVADRQKNVILKGFNYLQKDGNDFLYIGDEVGLGKTYIAIGIMSLLRHFSSKRDYKDLIIVPKSNLQKKWQKEINKFVKTNWKYKDTRVKSLTNTSVGLNDNRTLFGRLSVNSSFDSAYLIFRMSSFSLGINNNNWNDWINELNDRLGGNEIALKYFKCGEKKGYFRQPKDSKERDRKQIKRLKRFYAYLLNIIMPEIDCLVVDEAHNYRKGNSDADMSSRNAVTSCLFGVKKDSLQEGIFIDDEKLRKEFFGLIKSKARKVVLLSATPIKSSLTDIINQIDCFKEHNYTSENIKSGIDGFMIRGIMNMNINGQIYSRNQYRYEHRNGGVIEADPEKPLKLDNDTDAITFGLFQYKLIEKLHKPRFNKSFEIGMLAGFETFCHDSKRIIEKEFEEVNSLSHRPQDSVDSDIIRELIESYQIIMNVDDYPRHPKQEILINELYNMAIRQKKALVYVRRIATAYELEQRLMKKFEQEFIFPKLQKLNNAKKYKSGDLDRLIMRFKEKKNEDILPKVYEVLWKRLKGSFNEEIIHFFDEYTCSYYDSLSDTQKTISGKIALWFEYLYDRDTEFKNIILRFIKRYIKSNNSFRINSQDKATIKNKIEITIEYWKKELINRSEQIDPDADEEDSLENEKYFFNRFFIKNEGLAFKNRVRIQDWLEFNYFLINKEFLIFGFDETKLTIPQINSKTKKNKIIDIYTDIFVSALNEKGYVPDINVPDEYNNNTFLTRLITEKCRAEFGNWLKIIRGKNRRKEFIINEIDILEAILKNIFRNGSGLLPAFIADKAGDSFDEVLFELISDEKYFGFVLDEIKNVLDNYTILRNTNFSDVNTLSEDATKIHSLFRNISPIIGTTGQDRLKKNRVAAQFRLPGFPYVLITTDVLKEGEDLQTFCKNIYHYGIAWSPIDMEQRTGRIDRIGSFAERLMKANDEINYSNDIQVYFPYISDSIEVNQVSKLFQSMNNFIKTFYDFTITANNDSTVSSEESVNKIPEQTKVLLKSKYEYKPDGLADIRNRICNQELCSGESILIKMREIFEKIKSLEYCLNLRHTLNNADYSISGTFLLPGQRIRSPLFKDLKPPPETSVLRRGPFKIALVFDPIEQEYIFNIYSKIGKCTPGEVTQIGGYVNNVSDKVNTIEVNENLLLYKGISIHSSIEDIISLLKEIIINADILEYHFFKGADDQDDI
ncbi:MAG TPA: hypothetical protein ENG87_01680 [Candidatus Pacearchaeota archaeon]|nr:hypothetical protein [Candidatus Pacearchaeota archaeon]